jgi:hypothetical protein
MGRSPDQTGTAEFGVELNIIQQAKIVSSRKYTPKIGYRHHATDNATREKCQELKEKAKDAGGARSLWCDKKTSSVVSVD